MEKETYILSISDFDELKNESWGGAVQTLEQIEEKGKQDEFIQFLNEIIQCNDVDGVKWTETQLNDFIAFEDDYISDCLGVELWEE